MDTLFYIEVRNILKFSQLFLFFFQWFSLQHLHHFRFVELLEVSQPLHPNQMKNHPVFLLRKINEF